MQENTDNLRRIKSFVKRTGRVTKKQQSALDNLKDIYTITYNAEKKLCFTDIFGNSNNVILEIGFGMGTSLLQMAEENPHLNYLGIEVHQAGVGNILHEIEERQIKNLFIINYDAIEVFKNMLDDNSLSGIQIYFPDPWHKKRHNKRRLVNPINLHLFSQKMKRDGIFHFASDWLPYAEEVLELLENDSNFVNQYNGFSPRPDFRPLTKFEKRGQNLEHTISDIIFKKV